MKPILIFSFPALDNLIALARKDFEVLLPPVGGFASSSEILELAHSKMASALIVTMTQKIDANFLAALPASVKVVSTCSVGHDHMDLAAAKRRGLLLTNTPDVLTEATADMAFLLMLGASRRMPEYTQVMRGGWGRFFNQNEMLGFDISRKTLGIYGMGRIGQALADRARGFGMKILYCNRHRLPPDLEKGATYFSDFHAMLPQSQILSLNAPSTPQTQGVMNAKAFAALPPNAILVNVARGSLLDENALFDALDSGRLFAAGLDVFQNEPRIDPRFYSHPRLFLSPHMGSATVETRTAMGLRALDNVRIALSGGNPPDLLV